MSYYILPKINTEITIDPCLNISMHALVPYISHSIVNYLNEVTNTLQLSLVAEKSYTFKSIYHLVHPYEYLFSTIPNSNISVSKLKPASSIFYDIMEIYNTLKITDVLPSKFGMNALYYGKNSSSVLECIQLLREEYDDNNILIEPILFKQPIISSTTNTTPAEIKYPPIPDHIKGICDFIYFDLHNNNKLLDINDYVLELLKVIMLMLKYQSSCGSFILKINHVYYKPVIDVLYIISSLYEKVYIIKPSTTNNIIDDKYLVCKTFVCQPQQASEYFEKINKIYTICYKDRHDIIIQSLIKNELSVYFLNKIEESNIIIGQQQIESYDQLINLLKNKNKVDKIETMRKNNIQKCMNWCDKYALPYNKFADRINIFLPTNVYDDESIKETQNYDDNYYDNDDAYASGQIVRVDADASLDMSGVDHFYES
jgi:hypothetical protein